jgi:DNA-binding LacI/PurR family transcriptional regulator
VEASPVSRGRVRRPTLNDLAARAGVSRASASLVIRAAPGPSPSTRERVLRAAAELGYRPDPAAQLLRRRRSYRLGVLINPREAFHADLIEAIYPAAERLGYEVVLGALIPGHAENQAIEALIGSRCEALVLLGPSAGDRGLATVAARLPVVAVGRRAKGTGADTVSTADVDGVRQAIDHLVDLGHRSIVHVDGGRAAGSAQRRAAFRKAMRRHGLAAEAIVVPGDHTEEAGARAARSILDTPLPATAVFASNDRCAVGVLDTLIRSGVDVPADMSVVGFDDSQLSRLAHINLTTVRQDAEQMAQLAVHAAVERVEGRRTTPRDVAFNPQLVVRGTTAPPRAAR